MNMLQISDLEKALADYVKGSAGNYITEERAISRNLIGLQIYDPPLVGAADARDSLFHSLKKEGAIGPHFMLPQEWMESGKTVISFFLPFTEEIKRANVKEKKNPAPEWLHGRIEGNEFLFQSCRYLQQLLEAEGGKTVIPSQDKRFWCVEMPEKSEQSEQQSAGFTSNWSERHIAFVCGLGTFGLSKGLITKKGIAGRFVSLITDLEIEPVKREYTDLYEYCVRCGACIERCPVRAISFENGKKHEPCAKFLNFTREKYAPRYGCGKCQTGVPCESGIPKPESR